MVAHKFVAAYEACMAEHNEYSMNFVVSVAKAVVESVDYTNACYSACYIIAAVDSERKRMDLKE